MMKGLGQIHFTFLAVLVAVVDCQSDIFRLFYRYGFNDGRIGDPQGTPSQADIEGLICATNNFMTDELKSYAKNEAIEVFATEISWGFEDWIYNGTEPEAPRNVPVIINFTAMVTTSDGSNTPSNQELWEATKYFKYFSYIMDYVWQLPNQNFFKDTRGIWYEPFIQQPVTGQMKESSKCPGAPEFKPTAPKETPSPTAQTPGPTAPTESTAPTTPVGTPPPSAKTQSPSMAAAETPGPTVQSGETGSPSSSLQQTPSPSVKTPDPTAVNSPAPTASPKTNSPTARTLAPTAKLETPGPTATPETPSPTKLPTTSSPTKAPETPSPTKLPTTSSSTKAPETPSPTKLPTTSSPTKAPETPSPTELPATPAPTKAPETESPTESQIGDTPMPTLRQQQPLGGGMGIFGGGGQTRPPRPRPSPADPGRGTEPGITTAPETRAPDPTPPPSTSPSAARPVGRPPGDGDRTLAPTTKEEELVYFNIKMDFFDGMGREPKADEVGAMICQTNNFFKQTIRELTNDPNIESYATNIDWEYNPDESLPFTVYFTSHTTDGQGQIIPAADMYNYILKDADAKSLVTDYIWNSEPYPFNIFYQTEDIMLGGSYSGAKKGRPLVPGKFPKAICPT